MVYMEVNFNVDYILVCYVIYWWIFCVIWIVFCLWMYGIYEKDIEYVENIVM